MYQVLNIIAIYKQWAAVTFGEAKTEARRAAIEAGQQFKPYVAAM